MHFPFLQFIPFFPLISHYLLKFNPYTQWLILVGIWRVGHFVMCDVRPWWGWLYPSSGHSKHVQSLSFWWCSGSTIHGLCVFEFWWPRISLQDCSCHRCSALCSMIKTWFGNCWCKINFLSKASTLTEDPWSSEGILTSNEFVTDWRHSQSTCSLISHEVTSKIYSWKVDTHLSRGNECRVLCSACQLLNFNLKCQAL